MKIYGDQISGNCLKVKWTADLLGINYQWLETDILAGESRTDEFLALNPAGQVPTVVLPGHEVISQSNAIILYLARKCKSALIPADDLAYGLMLQWMFWEQYSHEPTIAVRRFHKHYLKKSDNELDPKLLEKGNAALLLMDNELSCRGYFVGSTLTAADIVLVAYTRVAPEGGFNLSSYPNLVAWISRVETDLGIKPIQDF